MNFKIKFILVLMNYFSNSLIRLNRKYFDGELYSLGSLEIKEYNFEWRTIK